MIIAVGAALALTACVNNEMVDDAAPKEVSFKSFNLGESTRGVFEGNEFMVYAKFTNAGDGSDYVDYWGANAQLIDESKGYWATKTGTYYWPKAGAISFWGYYPADQEDVTFDTTNGVMVADVDATEAAELMLADPAQSALKTGNNVPMVFKHAGAQVIFRFANADYKVATNEGFDLTINSVSISEVMPKANYQWSGWSNWSGAATAIGEVADKVITNTTIGSEDIYTFNVVPQAVDQSGNPKKITIAYTVKDKNANYSYTGTATLDATNWNENTKHYYNVTFTFTVGAEIMFAPTTTDWSTEDEGYNVVG